MSSASSTEPDRRGHAAGLQPWQFYLLLSLIAATTAVALTHQTSPAALILLSAAIVAAGIAATALHSSLAGFFGLAKPGSERGPLGDRPREMLEREKMFILRSIKELEFDHAMSKVSDKDFAEIGGRLRARALTLMQELDRTPEPNAPERAGVAVPAEECAECGTRNDPDALFCKRCGAKIA